MDSAEAAAQKKAGNLWFSLRYAVLAAEDGEVKGFERLERELREGPVGFDRVLLRGTAVDLALRTGDAKLILEKIKVIPGETLGAWARVRYCLRAAELVEGSESGQFLTAAKAEMHKCLYPKLKVQLRLLIEEGGL